MSHSTHKPPEPNQTEGAAPATPEGKVPHDTSIEVDERAPDGGQPDIKGTTVASGATAGPEATAAPPPSTTVGLQIDDDEPAPELHWYVLKVQSSREDTIRDALQRRVKILGLQRYFGQIVVPTEKITEIRNNKKRVVERKTYPGYIMLQCANPSLNEKTWYLVRETPGVGDFVGAHGTPTKMTETEVNQMLHQEEEKTTAEAPKVRIPVERGDRVKIKDGPFENFEGTVEEVIEGRGLVKVMLIIFNRPTPVDLEYWQVERI
ncbi:MAG: transcription termination/antitermination protein NusG [Isosphaerales bacterium]